MLTTVLQASQSPAHVIVAGRNPAKLQESIDVLKAKFPNVDYRPLVVDLSTQKSVRAAAAEVLSWADVPTIDIIINSGGVMLTPERTLTEDGIELHFATNHIGHFLLSCLLMPKLIKAAESSPKGATRIVNVTSLSPTVARMRWSDPNFDKINKTLPEVEQPPYEMLARWGYTNPQEMSYIPLEGYNQSKVANVLFSIAATKRLYEKHGILSLAVHPGIIKTELARDGAAETVAEIRKFEEMGAVTYKTLGAGSSTSLVAALDPKMGPGETKEGSENYGAYLIDCQITTQGHPLAVSSSEAEKLWALSEKLVNEKMDW